MKDNGIGIDPNYICRIYEMFYRATEESKGAGLGLYIVKETLNKRHGFIRAQFNLGGRS